MATSQCAMRRVQWGARPGGLTQAISGAQRLLLDFLARRYWRLVQDPTFESAKKRLEAGERHLGRRMVLCETTPAYSTTALASPRRNSLKCAIQQWATLQPREVCKLVFFIGALIYLMFLALSHTSPLPSSSSHSSSLQRHHPKCGIDHIIRREAW